MAVKNGGTNWGYIFGGAAVGLTVILNILGYFTSGTEKLEKRVNTIEQDLAWKYVNKELAAKDIGFIERTLADLKSGKVDRNVYDMKAASVDRQLALLRDHYKDLDRSINQTFNARDALTALQSRILELERAARK